MTTENTSNEGGEGQTDHSEVQKEAESQGWVPKEKYRGNESDWVDADTFVQRGRQILPILRKNNETLLKDLNATKKQLEEFRQTAEEFKKYQKENYERKATDLAKQITELKASRAQAITDGDGQKVNALDDAIDEAKEGVKEAKEAAKDTKKQEIDPPSSIDPVLGSWLADNEWFGKDRKLTSLTNALGEALRSERPELQGKAFLDELDVQVSELRGKVSKGKAPSSVESGSGRGPAGSGKKSYNDLPADAKAACDKYVAQKLLTREQYLAEYSWD